MLNLFYLKDDVIESPRYAFPHIPLQFDFKLPPPGLGLEALDTKSIESSADGLSMSISCIRLPTLNHEPSQLHSLNLKEISRPEAADPNDISA